MYFKILPDLNYLKYSNNPYQGELIRIKNLFTRAIFSKFASKFVTIFDTYIIKDGDRPDTLAYKLYGDSYYDWVIITCNDRLINFYDQWPKQSTALEQYAIQKYGTGLYDIHHYETLEIKDSNGNIVLPSGLKVDSSFTFTYSDGGATITKSGSQVLIPVTNFDYEYNENENKRYIQLLKPQYLTLFENEMKSTLVYNTNAPNVLSQYVKTTEKDILPTI
jgi:Base plate wedge protein 53